MNAILLAPPQFRNFEPRSVYDSPGIPFVIIRAGFCGKCQEPRFGWRRDRIYASTHTDGLCDNCHHEDMADQALWTILNTKLTIKKLATEDELLSLIGPAYKRLGTRKEISRAVLAWREERRAKRESRIVTRRTEDPLNRYPGTFTRLASQKRALLTEGEQSKIFAVGGQRYRLRFVLEQNTDWEKYSKAWHRAHGPARTTEYRGLFLEVMTRNGYNFSWARIDHEPCQSVRDCHQQKAYEAINSRNRGIFS